MKQILVIAFFIVPLLCSAQQRTVQGTYSSTFGQKTVKLNADSTFEYLADKDPVFYSLESFYEKGRYKILKDTIIFNPDLERKAFVESELKEQNVKENNALNLTFNLIKRYIAADGKVTKQDTLQVQSLDYAFNEMKKANIFRVCRYRTVRCAYAGYIPPETITNDKNITVQKPEGGIKSLFISCSELQGTKEFGIKDPDATHLTVNIYTNYYSDGQLRQAKFLLRNNRILFLRQNSKGGFERQSYGATLIKKKKENKPS